MSEYTSWLSPEGQTALKAIVASEIPAWKDGLRERQIQPILRILDGQDVLLCTATGDGKSALFTVPIICHLALRKSPDSFPKFRRICKEPVGIVITPTKGLARNIVETLAKHNISAIAYDRETIIAAASAHRNLSQEIASCQYHIICIDPEHLKSATWRKIFVAPTLQENLIFVGVEEVHLVYEWVTFRQPYGYIGQFVRGHLPPNVSVFGLSATLEPGIPTTAICQSLGFRNFHLFRFSNERRDIQMILEPLKHAVSGRSFSQLLPYLNAGRNVVVYVNSMEISNQLYLYLVKMDPSGRSGQRIRQYNALLHPDFNSQTLRLLESDSELQIIIATIALANGVHSSAIDDVIQYQMAKTLSSAEQEAGRASRPEDATGRAVILVQKSDLKNAKKFMEAAASAPTASPAPLQPSGRQKRGKAKPEDMDPAKAEFLVETTCLNAVRNRRWQNEPLSETTRDCIAAERPLPCSLCAARANITITFPRRDIPYPPFLIPSAAKRTPVPRATKLKKERAPNCHCPTRCIRSQALRDGNEKLADALLRLTAIAELDIILDAHNWPFRSSSHREDLWTVIKGMQTSVVDTRKAEASSSKKGRASAKDRDREQMEIEEESETAVRRSTRKPSDSETTAPAPIPSSSIPPASAARSQRKRALDDVTNERATKTRTTDTRTVKELQAEFGPTRTSYRRDRARG
ncbi:P-loop containing nucleoside triphosphate hydrolase protein [Mycena sanguinolenta]|uniref:DNA 3'-5' helicase n=1 Tax=Mycena sanguinolenta TaxID=230812 RepID=A0A8H6X630_9AGAR|nr:P-loop containing nucleoside triphosphate hydrolase protein [Mycena sanguinolenta]